ncbi:hypothetical protein [Glutamicibacter creatinolyticus]|uniref:hypothetical protein n=1 Tax=Glutamicibacter creatinolyticus TaxID=162496 RepID=UPI003217B09D
MSIANKLWLGFIIAGIGHTIYMLATRPSVASIIGIVLWAIALGIRIDLIAQDRRKSQEAAMVLHRINAPRMGGIPHLETRILYGGYVSGPICQSCLHPWPCPAVEEPATTKEEQ